MLKIGGLSITAPGNMNFFIKNKEGGITYLIGAVDTVYDEFWCSWETKDKEEALRYVETQRKSFPGKTWAVVKQTTTFDSVAS